jgi:cytochrome c553
MAMKRATHRLRVLAALAALVTTLGVARAGSPQYDYVTHCMGCHGPVGNGVAGKIPALRESLPAFARTGAGRAFVLSVPGASNSSLTDAELAAVMTWLLERFATAASEPVSPAFTEAEVAKFRRPPLSRVREARSAALKTLAGTGPVPAEDY